MKKILIASALTLGFATQSQAETLYKKVTGLESLKNQSINQYDDGEPPQGYLVTLPNGYRLDSAEVAAEGIAICGISSFNPKTQNIKIDGHYLETDSGSCDITLDIYDVKNKKHLKAIYNIYSIGT